MNDLTFVGLGGMGTAMARHLLERGRTVSVWNRSEEAVQRLVAAGATPVTDRRALLATGLTFSMLANDAAVTDVFTEEVLAAAPEGAIHVNMATVGLPTADAMVALHQQYGVTYIAAPVLGRPNVAAEGQLNIVAAGDETAITKVQPYLDLIGKRTWVVGELPRAANLVKLAVNFNLIHAIQALAESLTLVEAGGVASSTFVDILTDAAFTGSVYKGYGKLIADRDYDPKFSVALGAKDLGLLSNAADEHGIALPSVPMLRSVYEATLARPELADLDWSATAEVTRRQHPLAQER